MTRSSGIVLVASMALCATFAFAAIEFRRMGTSFAALEDRVARVETATGVTAADSAGRGDGAAQPSDRTPATIAGVHEEVVKLREELARLRKEDAGGGDVAANPPVPVAGGDPAKPMAKEELAKAVTDALAAKEKADKEKQAKLYKKQMEQSAKSWANQIAGKLGLTEQQKQQVAEIFAEHWTKMSTAWTDAQADENAEAVDYQKLNEQMNEKVKAVLTPEQGAKYDEMMKKNNWWGGGGSEDDESGNSAK